MPNTTSPVDFLSHHCWGCIKALSAMEQFKNLDRDIEVTPVIVLIMSPEFFMYNAYLYQGSAKRWKKFTDSECPEKEKFPGEWKNKNSLQKLCMMRALRPDRMTYAVTYVTAPQIALTSLTHYLVQLSLKLCKKGSSKGETPGDYHMIIT